MRAGERPVFESRIYITVLLLGDEKRSSEATTGVRGAQRLVLRVNEPKKTIARSARAAKAALI